MDLVSGFNPFEKYARQKRWFSSPNRSEPSKVPSFETTTWGCFGYKVVLCKFPNFPTAGPEDPKASASGWGFFHRLQGEGIQKKDDNNNNNNNNNKEDTPKKRVWKYVGNYLFNFGNYFFFKFGILGNICVCSMVSIGGGDPPQVVSENSRLFQNPKVMEVFGSNDLFKGMIFSFHLSFRGGVNPRKIFITGSWCI